LSIFEKIDSLNGKYIDVWEDVCNIESPSNYKEGVDAVGNYFCELARKQGWRIERYPQERFGDVVCITMNPDSKERPVVFSGHMDTVHPIGLFGNPPSRRDGDRLIAPGATDCKGGVVAGFLAMQAIAECGYKDRPIMMLLQSNEEVGSGINNKDTINYMCERSKDAVAFLNLEGYVKGKICIERKGIAGFTLHVHGVAAHSSLCASRGSNAVAEAAHKIIELEKIKDGERLTFSCNIVHGGVARNTVPPDCDIILDVRFKTQKDFEEAKEIINKVAEHTTVAGCSCDVEMTNLRPPMELCDRNVSLLERINAVFKENGLPVIASGAELSGSDAADVTVYGIPCIDSIGVEGRGVHTKDEYGILSSLAESAKRLAAIAVSL
jgi:glutamate carboxypeptidase